MPEKRGGLLLVVLFSIFEFWEDGMMSSAYSQCSRFSSISKIKAMMGIVIWNYSFCNWQKQLRCKQRRKLILLGIFPDSLQIFSSSLILHLCHAKAEQGTLIRSHSLRWLCLCRWHSASRKCLGTAFCGEYIACSFHFLSFSVCQLPKIFQ